MLLLPQSVDGMTRCCNGWKVYMGTAVSIRPYSLSVPFVGTATVSMEMGVPIYAFQTLQLAH